MVVVGGSPGDCARKDTKMVDAKLPIIPSREEFFAIHNAAGTALTFDDVRLRTGYSEVMPAEVNIESKFSRNIGLKIPLVSAAMDTVTEHRMAISMAKFGGIGIIHKNHFFYNNLDRIWN